MKMMEILKLWVRCMALAGATQKNPIALRTLVMLARAAQEYYTSGLHSKDIIDEIRNSGSTHPYLYDGTPHHPQGLAKIVGKYKIKNPYMRIPESLSEALDNDIYRKIITKNGDIDYNNPEWIRSRTLNMWCGTVSPKDSLPLALGKMLMAARQK